MTRCCFTLCLILLLPARAGADPVADTRYALERVEEFTEPVAAACDAIAGVLTEQEALKVIQADGLVEDRKAGSVKVGCMVYATISFTAKDGARFPHDRLRGQLESEGWAEEIARAGDGPGSTTFALSREDILCIFSAIWLDGAGEKGGASPGLEYELDAGCMKSASVM